MKLPGHRCPAACQPHLFRILIDLLLDGSPAENPSAVAADPAWSLLEDPPPEFMADAKAEIVFAYSAPNVDEARSNGSTNGEGAKAVTAHG